MTTTFNNMAMEEETEVATYIGQKGYSIYKENMSVKDQHSLREELIVRPYVPKARPRNLKGLRFIVNLPKKLYIPRFFGLMRMVSRMSIVYLKANRLI